MISKQHRASMERIKVKQQHVVLGGRRGVKRKNKLHDVIQALKYWFFFSSTFFPLALFLLDFIFSWFEFTNGQVRPMRTEIQCLMFTI